MSEDHPLLRSYGRLKSRPIKPRQAALMESRLPQLRVPAGAVDPGALMPGARETWLEIGFGGGEHLLWQATTNSSVGLIGCEPFEDGVVKALSAVEQEKLTNVRLHADDARPLLRWWLQHSLRRDLRRLRTFITTTP